MCVKWVDPTLISADSGLARLAIPWAVVLAVMSLADAYAIRRGAGLSNPCLLQPSDSRSRISSSPCTFSGRSQRQCLLGAADRLDIRLDTAGGIPTRYQPTPSRQRSGILAEVKLELAPFLLSRKSALVPCAILLAAILYLLGR